MTLDLSHATCGRGGRVAAEAKREGDGATPMGTFPLREIWFRPDRVALTSQLPTRAITPDDCWCDDPAHALYNQHCTLADTATMTSHERLYRDDHAYDIIVAIGYNDVPIVAGKGSAIFMHCEHDDKRPTAGCVALPRRELAAVCERLTPASTITITADAIWIS